MKYCNYCKTTKELACFAKNKTMKDGLQAYCKDCNKDIRKKYKNRSKEYAARFREQNKELCNARIKEWKKSNKGKVNSYTAKRHSSKMSRTPKWADFEKIKSYYDVCSFFNEVNGYTKYHVDHIIPLQGKEVSGLHVHTNLQILLADENIKKSNTFDKWSGY